MQIKQSSRRRERGKKGCEKKTFCFLLLWVLFAQGIEWNPLRGIFAELTVCIYQFFMTFKYLFFTRERTGVNVQGVFFYIFHSIVRVENFAAEALSVFRCWNLYTKVMLYEHRRIHLVLLSSTGMIRAVLL